MVLHTDNRTQVRTAAAERRRQDITAVAATLFHDVGYHETGLRQIAAAAAMSKPTLYHYFQNKDDILYAIHDEFIDLIIARHEDMIRTPGSMQNYLRGVMSMIMDIVDSHGAHLRVFFEHYRELRPEYRESLSAKRDQYYESVQRIVADGVANGEFRPVDVPLVTMGIFGMCNWATNWYRHDGHRTPHEIADTFFDVVVRGLGTASPDGRADGLVAASPAK